MSALELLQLLAGTLAKGIALVLAGCARPDRRGTVR